MDINIAYSMLNMKLRDFYSSIDILCEDEEVDKEALISHFKDNPLAEVSGSKLTYISSSRRAGWKVTRFISALCKSRR